MSTRTAQQTGGVKPSTIVYWMRLGFAALAALMLWALGLPGTLPAVGVGVFVYALSCALVRYGFRYNETQLKGRYRFVTIGMGTYAIWLIFLLVALFSCGAGHVVC